MTTEGIEKLVDIVGNKYEETVHIISKSSEIRKIFNPPIRFDPNKNYKIALKYFSVYNNIFNITEKNNVLKFKSSDDWQEIELTPGAYEIKNINDSIKRNDKTKDNIEFQADIPTGRVLMKLKNDYKVDLNHEKSFRNLLGFEPKIYAEKSNLSENYACINAGRLLINVKCDCINSGYVNNGNLLEIRNILFSIPTYTVQPGYKILETPNKPEYLRINKSQLSEINLRVVDENDLPYDFKGDDIVIKLHIKQV